MLYLIASGKPDWIPDGYIAQLWLFWVAPLLGGRIGAVVARWQREGADER